MLDSLVIAWCELNDEQRLALVSTTLLVVSELIVFLPTRYNGLAHTVLGILKSTVGKKATSADDDNDGQVYSRETKVE